MFLIFELLLLAILGGIGYAYYKVFVGEYVISQPNEWMIVLRNGKIRSMGVGITSRVSYFDSCVKFPSKIHKVHFNAQQVTKEMQGVEVSGVILWSVNPKEQLPLKAVMYLGKDLTKSDAKTAKHNLAEMCSAIVSHNVANSTIDEIVKNRDMLRNSITKGISRVIEGWGCLVESVEITDVKILSSSLFKNLQVNYREDQRKKAQLINMNTDKQLKHKRLQDNLEKELQKLKDEINVQKNKNKQKIKLAAENLKMFEKQREIQLEKNRQSQQLKKKMLFNEAEVTKMQNAETAKLNLLNQKLEEDTIMQARELALEKLKKQKEAALARRKIKEMKTALKNRRAKKDAQLNDQMSETNLRLKKLELVRDIFNSGNMYSNMSLTNFGDVGTDPCLNLIKRLDSDLEKLTQHFLA
jgi:hypothetical protein